MTRKWMTVGTVLALALIVVAGSTWWLNHAPGEDSSTPTPFPPAPPFVLPPSFEDLAASHPEIADLLSDPKLGSAYKDFLVAYQLGGRPAAEELAAKRGMLNERGELHLLLVLDTDDSGSLVAQLRAAGVRVENHYRDLVAVAVPLSEIEAAASSGDPGAVLRPLTELEHVVEIRLPESPVPGTGPVQGEGVTEIGADEWHDAGWTGKGVKVAILDGAFESHQVLVGTELPGNVVYRSFGADQNLSEEEKRHGTACAEVIHDIAPDAELFLVTYANQIGLGQAVHWLIDQDVDIISYSMGWLAGPRDGTSRQAEIVNEAHAAGILWVNSAGNSAQSHYAGTFEDLDGDNLHEFEPGEETLAFWLERRDDVYIALNWDDWPRSDQDLDLHLLNLAGQVLASARDPQNGSQSPTEEIQYELGPGVFYLVVEAAAVSRAVHLDLFVSDGYIEESVQERSLGIPADAKGAMAVGAVHWGDDSLEPFSSRGPSADGRSKPEISAPDGVQGVSYDRFFGTSAAAPHVAGAAALVLDAFPNASPAELASYLQTHARDLGPPGVDNGYGSGVLDLPLPSSPTPPGPSFSPTPAPIAPTATPTPSPTSGPTPVPATPSPMPPTPVASPVGADGRWSGVLFVVLGVAAIAPLMVWAMRAYPRLFQSLHAPMSRKKTNFCGRCGQRSRPGARFCLQCGSPLALSTKRCSRCGLPAYSGRAKFCGHCGTRL